MNPPIYQVLLLEHDREFVQYLRQMLGQTTAAAFAVSETPTFAEGLRRLVELRPDVVIIDLAIPDGGGLANIRVLQDLDASVPILVFGKADDETLALEVKHAGAADYLIKTQLTPPFLSRALIYAIERHQHVSHTVGSEALEPRAVIAAALHGLASLNARPGDFSPAQFKRARIK